jgi:integrase/recombinase XerD
MIVALSTYLGHSEPSHTFWYLDTTVIALWLGHEQVETTQVYVHADLAIKEQALARTAPVNGKPGRYRPPDSLLAFLEAL